MQSVYCQSYDGSFRTGQNWSFAFLPVVTDTRVDEQRKRLESIGSVASPAGWFPPYLDFLSPFRTDRPDR
jgi:hypothetical protein